MNLLLVLFCLFSSQNQANESTQQSRGDDRSFKLEAINKKNIQGHHYTSFLLDRLILEDHGQKIDKLQNRLTNFHNNFFPLVISLSNAIGNIEEPQAGLRRALKYFTEKLGFHLNSGEPGLTDVIPDKILKTRRGSQIMLTILFLSMIERHSIQKKTRPVFPLSPIMVNGNLLLRYEFKDYTFNVSLSNGGILLNDRETLKRWHSNQAHGKTYFKSINKTNLMGLMLGELAKAFATSGNYALQHNYLKMAISFFPDSMGLRLRLSRDLLRNGQIKEAINNLKIILRNNPECGEAHFLNGVAQLSLKNLKESKKALKKACKYKYTESGKIWIYLAYILDLEGTSTENLNKYLAQFMAATGRSDLSKEVETIVREVKTSKVVATLLSHTSYSQKFKSIDFLKKFPTKQGIGALISSLKDPNVMLRVYAWKALCEIAGEQLPPTTTSWWNWLSKQPKDKTQNLWQFMDIVPQRKETGGGAPIAER